MTSSIIIKSLNVLKDFTICIISCIFFIVKLDPVFTNSKEAFENQRIDNLPKPVKNEAVWLYPKWLHPVPAYLASLMAAAWRY